MNSKILVFAAVSAAVIAMSGCTSTPPYPLDAGGKTQVDCSSTLDCQVPLPHHWWKLDYPDEIYVKVLPGQKLMITWTIQGNDGTTFNQQDGIYLKDASGQAVFKCNPDSVKKHVYTCYNIVDLARDGEYKYGIKTKGIVSGLDVDPVIKNGA